LSDKKLKLSVVLHAARSGYNVRKCITSLLDQSVPRDWYEVIVVDDASTDSTADVLRSYGSSLKVIRTETKWGSSKSRNVGVSHAKGDLLFFTGVDCVADNLLLEEHIDSHSRRDGCAVVGRILWQSDLGKNSFLKFIQQSGDLFCQTTSSMPDPENVSYPYTYTANLSLPKQTFLSVGMSDERLFPGYYSDTELGYRLERAGHRTIFNSKATVYHSTDLSLRDFSRRMVTVGKSAVTLESINPLIVDFSHWKDSRHSILSLTLLTRTVYLKAIFLQLLEKFHQSGGLRARLFSSYRKQLDYSCELGYVIQRKQLENSLTLSSHWTGALNALLSVYGARSDLKNAFPGVTGGWSTQRDLIHWAATWGIGIDGAERFLGQYGPLYVLVDVYSSRPDLRLAYPEAGNGVLDDLVSWAAEFGVTTDSAKPILQPYASWYRTHRKQ
jgi:glycosyltransferase involved in cell wall biosynthesis